MSVREESLRRVQQKTNSPEKEILRYAEEQFKKAKKERLQFERQWYLNIAFYFGKQYVTWAGAGVTSNYAKLHEPAAPPWRVRLVSNKIRPIIRAELAKITKERPTAFVIPATSDDDDVAAAKAGEHIFEHHWRDLKVPSIVRRAAFWEALCGTSFIKDWFESETVDSSGVKGAVKVEAITPFHLYAVDMQEEVLENQPFIIHALAKSPEWVEQNFGKQIAPDSGGSGGSLESKFLSAIGIESQGKTHVAVKEMWVKSNKKFPDGAKILWAGEELLDVTEGMVYNHGQYPFSKLDHIPTGRFYSDSTIVDLIPLQREYNRTRSQIIEAKNRMAKPQLAAARGSIDPNKITSEPGLIILYQPGYTPPVPIPLTPLPTYVLEEVDRIQRDMDDISSQHEITKGRTPPGVTAATAIAYLQEQDDSKLSATISSLEEAVENIGRHILSHVNQYWDAERQIRVVGEENQFESYMFSKAALRGSIDLRVEAGSATPVSRAAKQAFIMDIGDKGWISPEQALRYLSMAETTRMYEEMQLDARQAQRYCVMLSEGVPVPVHTYDNHAVHMFEIDKFRKKQSFDNMSDDIKVLFEQKHQAHKMLLAQQQGMSIDPNQQMPPITKPDIQAMAGQQPGMEQNGAPPVQQGSPV